MILQSISRADADSEEIWKLVQRANRLTQGSYSSWIDNAAALTRLLKRIMELARKEQAWFVYFTTIMKLLYFLRLPGVNNYKDAFKIAELYHHDYPLYREQAEASSPYMGNTSYNICELIMSLYLDYPQITDDKMEQMLNLFYENVSWYGSQYNNYNYRCIMNLGLMNHDRDMVNTARRKLDAADYSYNCYVCYYVKSMLGFYIMDDDYDGLSRLITNVCEKTIPVKYRGCYDMCEGADELTLVTHALAYCLNIGSSGLFKQMFADRGHVFLLPEEEPCVRDIVFHALAGNWLDENVCLQLADSDNSRWKQHRETPYEIIKDALYWYCYFQMLDRKGIHMVRLDLADDAGKDWTCPDAAAYFLCQADLIGSQMEKARRRFDYGRMKRTYEECLLNI